jgi:hypothetical protein
MDSLFGQINWSEFWRIPHLFHGICAIRYANQVFVSAQRSRWLVSGEVVAYGFVAWVDYFQADTNLLLNRHILLTGHFAA